MAENNINIDHEDVDDDDEADMFSFGTDISSSSGLASIVAAAVAAQAGSTSATSLSHVAFSSHSTESKVTVVSTDELQDGDSHSHLHVVLPARKNTDDSFLHLLESSGHGGDFAGLDFFATDSDDHAIEAAGTSAFSTLEGSHANHDAATASILAWLDSSDIHHDSMLDTDHHEEIVFDHDDDHLRDEEDTLNVYSEPTSLLPDADLFWESTKEDGNMLTSRVVSHRDSQEPDLSAATTTATKNAQVATSVPPIPIAKISPTVVALPPAYSCLADALTHDSVATVAQIRDLYQKALSMPSTTVDASLSSLSFVKEEKCDDEAHSPPLFSTLTSPNGCFVTLTKNQRAEMWCRLLNGGKSVTEVRESSAWVDDFRQWTASVPGYEIRNKERTSDNAEVSKTDWLMEQVHYLSSDWSIDGNNQQDDPISIGASSSADDLVKVLLFHHTRTTTQAISADATSSPDGGNDNARCDALILPVAATLTSVLPPDVASLSLTRIIPNWMPLLALEATERWEAARSLHQEFYHFACYHLPLLVTHLDRYLPGWYWPRKHSFDVSHSKASANPSMDGATIENSGSTVYSIATATERARKLYSQGQIPSSWLLSHLAGECGTVLPPHPHTSDGSTPHHPVPKRIPTPWLWSLWDRMLTAKGRTPARFCLTLAALELAVDDIMLLTGVELKSRLHMVWELKAKCLNNGAFEGNIDPELMEWWQRAQFLSDSTPGSVIHRLECAEDSAVQQALQRRQERVELELKTKLEAEAEAFRLAQESKADEARKRLTRARLVAFYRKHSPDKESNIDMILETYDGRFAELDAKLKLKYGEGFNPALKPSSTSTKPRNQSTNKLLLTMNQGFGMKRMESEDSTVQNGPDGLFIDKVVVSVTPAEVLPVICWSKQAAAARGEQSRQRLRGSIGSTNELLKFFLVDGRSEEATHEQGRFPTAVNLSPEAMLDPEKLEANEEMFESLRGAVHIVIMGEGFAALPKLYGQKISTKLEALMKEDESKTNICALFFVKKGFPFVSVLEGGFAAAHSWLVRQGPSHHLKASSVLVDYDPSASMFGQMEVLHNASTAEKAQRRMASLLESSLVTMTKRAQQLERLANDAENRNDGRHGMTLSFFGSRKESTDRAPLSVHGTSDTCETRSKSALYDSPDKSIAELKVSNNGETDSQLHVSIAGSNNDQYPNEKRNALKEAGKPSQQLSSAGGTAAISSILNRNPFNRFGSAGAGNTDSTKNATIGSVSPDEAVTNGHQATTLPPTLTPATHVSVPTSGFGGFNMFRVNAMARMRLGGMSHENTSSVSRATASSADVARLSESSPNVSSDANENVGVAATSGAPPKAPTSLATVASIPPAVPTDSHQSVLTNTTVLPPKAAEETPKTESISTISG